MPTRPGRPSGPEEPIEWEDVSRTIILQPRLPEERTAEQEHQAEALRQALPAPARGATAVLELFGCGCLSAVGVFSGLVTLVLGILILAGGKSGHTARELVQGRLFEGPPLSSGEIWGILIAPSLVLIVVGIPVIYLALRRWRERELQK